MSRKFFDIKENEAMCSKNFLSGEEGKIGKMFVIDRVELILGHQSHEMRELHGEDTLGVQQQLHSFNKIIEARHVS